MADDPDDMVNLSVSPALMKFAAENGGIESLQEAISEELDEMGAGTENGPDSIYEIFFHVLSWKGDHNVVLFPNEEGDCLVVDLCTMESRGKIASGPLAGKEMMVPRPLSQRGDA